MKSWFVFLVDGKKVGTWAKNYEEAMANMLSEFWDVPLEYLGINYGKLGTQPEKVTHRGMSAVDLMLAYGFGNMLSGMGCIR